MSLLFGRALGDTPNQLVPQRARSYGTVTVSSDTAMRASAVWAAVALRADLVSTTPLIAYRQIGDLQVEIPASPFLLDPAGDGFGICDWLYSTQVDLDRTGNTVGIITARNALGLPAQVEPQPISQVSIRGKGARITSYRIGGTTYDPSEVWHERQYTVTGNPLGLGPIAYAAMTIGGYLSAQQFGLDWFGNGAIPSGRLKNIARTINPSEAATVKDRFKAAVQNREVFVHGADWEWSSEKVTADESQFLATMEYGIQDIARFMGVPGDLIDAPAQSSAKVTYANITQRHLQFLVMKLGPVLRRRESALSAALARPRFVKFDEKAFLRLDPQTLGEVLNAAIAARRLAPSEARAIDNRPPFTEEQIAEFERLFEKATTPGAAPAQKTGA